MTQEKMSWFANGNVLANTQVANPWWRRSVEADGIDTSGFLFDGDIPWSAVEHLFLGEATAAYGAATLRPVSELLAVGGVRTTDDYGTVVSIDGASVSVVTFDGNEFAVVVAGDYRGIGPCERPFTTYQFASDTYDTASHQYSDMIAVTRDLVESDHGLHVVTAGKLRDGAVGWLQVALGRETTPEGVDYLPFLMFGGSFNGYICTQWKALNQLIVCDNTLDIGIRERSSREFKVRHTAHSGVRLADAKQALGLLIDSAADFAASVKALCEVEVTSAQWDAFLNAYAPSREDGSKIGQTKAENKRDQLDTLYHSDNRAATWNGTAFGMFQAAQTWETHYAIVRKVHRAERNQENVIRGKRSDNDAAILDVMSTVLERELLTV